MGCKFSFFFLSVVALSSGMALGQVPEGTAIERSQYRNAINEGAKAQVSKSVFAPSVAVVLSNYFVQQVEVSLYEMSQSPRIREWGYAEALNAARSGYDTFVRGHDAPRRYYEFRQDNPDAFGVSGRYDYLINHPLIGYQGLHANFKDQYQDYIDGSSLMQGLGSDPEFKLKPRSTVVASVDGQVLTEYLNDPKIQSYSGYTAGVKAFFDLFVASEVPDAREDFFVEYLSKHLKRNSVLQKDHKTLEYFMSKALASGNVKVLSSLLDTYKPFSALNGKRIEIAQKIVKKKIRPLQRQLVRGPFQLVDSDHILFLQALAILPEASIRDETLNRYSKKLSFGNIIEKNYASYNRLADQARRAVGKALSGDLRQRVLASLNKALDRIGVEVLIANDDWTYDKWSNAKSGRIKNVSLNSNVVIRTNKCSRVYEDQDMILF